MSIEKDSKDIFKVPATAGPAGKDKKNISIKEPPYHDLPGDQVRPPHG